MENHKLKIQIQKNNIRFQLSLRFSIYSLLLFTLCSANNAFACKGYYLDSVQYNSERNDHSLITNYTLNKCKYSLDHKQMKNQILKCDNTNEIEMHILFDLSNKVKSDGHFKSITSTKIESCVQVKIDDDNYYYVKYQLKAEVSKVIENASINYGYWFGKYDEEKHKNKGDTSSKIVIRESTKVSKSLQTIFNDYNFDTEFDSRLIMKFIDVTDINNDYQYDFLFGVETIASSSIRVYKITKGTWVYKSYLTSDPH